MARKQTRKSVSLSNEVFDRAGNEAELDEKSLSQWVSDLIADELTRRGRPLEGVRVHLSPKIVKLAIAGRVRSRRKRVIRHGSEESRMS